MEGISPTSVRRQEWLLWGIALLALLAAASAGGPVDDSYIFARYARNLLRGQVFEFNPGVRLEGFTSPAHLLLASLIALPGLDPLLATRIVSLGSGVLALLVVARLTRNYCAIPLVAPAAAMLTATALPWSMWSSSGMDATTFGLAVAWAVLLVEGNRGRERGGGAQSGHGSLRWLGVGGIFAVRPEGAVVYACLASAGWLRLRARGAGAREWVIPLIGAVPVVALSIFRRCYFGTWVPHTFHAKVGTEQAGEFWFRGGMYLVDAVIPLLPLLLLVILGVLAGGAARDAWGTLLVIAGMVFSIAVTGGDAFPMHRFAVPLIPLLACVGSLALGFVRRQDIRLASILGAGLVLLGCSMLGPGSISSPGGSGLDRYLAMVDEVQDWDHVGVALREAFGPDRTVAVITAGAIPYRTDWGVVDMYGITDPHIGRMQKSLGGGYAGHEKYDSDYVLRRKPDVVVLRPAILSSPMPPQEFLDHALWGDAARDLAARPEFRRRYRLIWLPVRGGLAPVHVRSVG